MMYLTRLPTLLWLLSVISIAQAIILDLDSLAFYELRMGALLRISVEEAIPLAFIAAAVGRQELSYPSMQLVSDAAVWLFGSSGDYLAKNYYDGIAAMNHSITFDKTTEDFQDNPILYFSLSRFEDRGRADGALYDPDADAYIVNSYLIEACESGTGDKPPHFLTINWKGYDVHDSIQLCPWYVEVLSRV